MLCGPLARKTINIGMNTDHLTEVPPLWRDAARCFAAMSDVNRQKILLLFEPGEELCVNQIASAFRLSRPAISHHLKILKDADLLLSEKRGKEVYYRVNSQRCLASLDALRDFMGGHGLRSLDARHTVAS